MSRAGRMRHGLSAALAAVALLLPSAATGAEWPEVRAILDASCVSCHGPAKAKGGLRLDSPAAITAGGKTGPVIAPREPELSSLYARVVLPADDPDVMPAKGERLTAAQQATIRAWIAAGAPMGDAAAPPAAPPAAQPGRQPDPTAALPDTDLDLAARGVPQPDAAALAALRASGAWSRALSRDGALIELDLSALKAPVTAAQLQPLAALAPNIVWLDLGGSGVTDRDLAHLRPLTRLARLHLERTTVGDAGVAQLAQLPELRWLNLCGTAVGDEGLRHLAGAAALETLYLHGSKATPAGVATLAAALPKARISLGETLPEAAPAAEPKGKGQRRKP